MTCSANSASDGTLGGPGNESRYRLAAGGGVSTCWRGEAWGLSFEQIVAEIEMHGVLDDVENPNPAYPHQRVLFVAVDGYAVAVPYVTDGETKFLKTAFHSRRATRIYLGG